MANQGNERQSEGHILSMIVVILIFIFLAIVIFKPGESRTTSQLIATTVGGIVAFTEWWKSKPGYVHLFLPVSLMILFVMLVLNNKIVVFLQNLIYGNK